jgi:hypothetical protein
MLSGSQDAFDAAQKALNFEESPPEGFLVECGGTSYRLCGDRLNFMEHRMGFEAMDTGFAEPKSQALSVI